MDTLMIFACSIVWILVTMIFRIFTPLTLRIELLVLWVFTFLAYLCIVFYIPYKKKLDTDVLDAKQHYFDNKDKLDPIYADQLKRKWEDDMVIRNKYYITMFIIWCYVHIPFYAIYLLYPTTNQVTLDNYMILSGGTLVLTSVIALFLWAGYTFGVLNVVTMVAAVITAMIAGIFFARKYSSVLWNITTFRVCVSLLYIALYIVGALVGGIMSMVYVLLYIVIIVCVMAILFMILVFMQKHTYLSLIIGTVMIGIPFMFGGVVFLYILATLMTLYLVTSSKEKLQLAVKDPLGLGTIVSAWFRPNVKP